MAGFIIGCVVGSIVGFFTAGLCIAAEEGDKHNDK